MPKNAYGQPSYFYTCPHCRCGCHTKEGMVKHMKTDRMCRLVYGHYSSKQCEQKMWKEETR